MKKLLFAVALLAFTIVSHAQNELKLAISKIEFDGTDGLYTLSLDNSMEIAGWSMTVFVPEGAEVVDFELSDRYEVNSRKKPYHQVTNTLTSEGGYLLICFATDTEHNIISGHSGELGTIVVDLSNYQGDKEEADIIISDFSVSDRSGNQFNLNEDAVGIRNILSSANASSEAVYNLQGQRVAGSHAKGVYIKNGKKVVKK